MRPWEAAGAAFFVYVIAVALLLPGLAAAARRRALAGSIAGLAVVWLSTGLSLQPVLHEWLLPPVLLLLGYWSSGALFVAPMARAERILAGTDRALRIAAFSAGAHRSLAEILELAYGFVYPLIPAALGLYLWFAPAPDADRFWTIMLVTDFICFGMLPWIQTRPPRAFEPGDPWRSSVRPLNLRLLGAASIGVNTFPSGHAAEALAAALLLIGAPSPLVVGMFVMAAAISAGAVLGRYHYALDALAGWLVALAVWSLA